MRDGSGRDGVMRIPGLHRACRGVHEPRPRAEEDHPDKPIAAHAVPLDVVLVTHNERDFAGYPGLRLENGLND